MAGPELLHLTDLYLGIRSEHPESIKQKYQRTIDIYRKRYPRILECLESNNFDITAVIFGADWQSVIDRYPEDHSYAIQHKTEF